MESRISIPQTIIAIAALAGITLLGWQGEISGDALVAIYSAVIGGTIGYVNGKRVSGDASNTSAVVARAVATEVASATLEGNGRSEAGG